MPVTFWLALILGAIAIVVFVLSRRTSTRQDAELRAGATVAFGVLVALTVLCAGVASISTVPVRSVGIATAFGKPTGQTTGSGLQLHAPWVKIEDWDASMQTADHASQDGCVTVRIGSLATACVEAKIRWQVLASAAPDQYATYKASFDAMHSSLVETEIQNSLNEVMATYNPLLSIDLTTGQTTFDGAGLATKVKTALQGKLGEQITVESVTVPLVHHDPATEENIRQIQNVVAKKRVLAQQQVNADIERQTAATLANVPESYAVIKCLDLAKELGKEPGLCMSGALTTWQGNR